MDRKIKIETLHKLAIFRILSHPDREDIHQEASFTTSGEPGEPTTKRSKTVVTEFEEWETSHNHNMEDEWDLLVWWKNNSVVLQLARSILCIPERNFRAAGLTFSQRRTALKPSTVDVVLFLHNLY
ncbi:hypothetical protein DPX16_0150 [Anabarilius grahami]|uniref:HAT C-terminal dimerisation domain-containing protein n=1 Tax=Anabarilius grahami TaxID=495550 RepID=A0A3N0XZA8_ANAGA|nr:hypothetical protein DPX16_0150 [Anabarilius grahami]